MKKTPFKIFINQQKYKTLKTLDNQLKHHTPFNLYFLFPLMTRDAKRQNKEDIILVH